MLLVMIPVAAPAAGSLSGEMSPLSSLNASGGVASLNDAYPLTQPEIPEPRGQGG